MSELTSNQRRRFQTLPWILFAAAAVLSAALGWVAWNLKWANDRFVALVEDGVKVRDQGHEIEYLGGTGSWFGLVSIHEIGLSSDKFTEADIRRFERLFPESIVMRVSQQEIEEDEKENEKARIQMEKSRAPMLESERRSHPE
jgi:hypothetical protein